MSRPRGLRLGEPAPSPRERDEAADTHAAEGDREEGEECRLAPLALCGHADRLHRREHPDSGEREQEERDAADRGVHCASPVATGTSVRRPHSLHDPS